MRIIYVYDRLYLYAWSMTYVINIIYHIIINYFYPVRVYDRTSYEAYHRLSTIIFQWRFHHFQSFGSVVWFLEFPLWVAASIWVATSNLEPLLANKKDLNKFPFFKFLNLLFCLKGLIIFIRRYVDRTTEKLKKKLVCLCVWKKFEIY